MVKTEIEKKEFRQEDYCKYPYIGHSETTGLIVYFISPHEGIYLAGKKTGKHCYDFAEESFKYFNGKVIIENI
jgi:hypothetical protein